MKTILHVSPEELIFSESTESYGKNMMVRADQKYTERITGLMSKIYRDGKPILDT